MTNSRNDKFQDNKNSDNRRNDSSSNESHEKGKQGFASMPKEQVRKIASEGGKHSHDNDSTRKNK